MFEIFKKISDFNSKQILVNSVMHMENDFEKLKFKKIEELTSEM